MYPIDSQNYYVHHGLVLPRQQESVRAIEASAESGALRVQREPQASYGRETAPRVERFVRGHGGLADDRLDLRSRQALNAYQSLSREGERDELSILIGIDTYA